MKKNKEQDKTEERFNVIVTNKENLIKEEYEELEDINVEGFWNQTEGKIMLCSYYNKTPKVHREISVKYNKTCDEFEFYNWLGDISELDHELEVGLTRLLEKNN